MLNYIPIAGWMLSFLFASVAAVPVWLIWTFLEYGTHYGRLLPVELQAPSYFGFVGLFMFGAICRSIFLPIQSPITKSGT